MRVQDMFGSLDRDMCHVCGQTPCNCTHVHESLRTENPCWKGYHPVGTKKKAGKTVPNCVPESEQGIVEGAGNIGNKIRSLYQKIYDQGDDAVEFAYNDSPIFAQYWDEYEGDLDSIIAEVNPRELQVILAELQSAAEDQGVAEGGDVPQWRVEQSDATGRYYVVSGYTSKSRRVWKNKQGAGDFNKKENAEAKAQELNQGVAEGLKDTIYPNAEVIKSKNGKPVGEIYQDGNSWGAFHYRADRGYDFIDSREEAIEALKDLHNETARHRPDYTIKGVAEGLDDTVAFEIDSENAYNQVMKRFGSVIDWDGDAMVVPRLYWPAVQEVAHDAGGAATEYGTEGVAEGFPHDVDHMPGPRIKNPQTGCKRCHGKGYVYKTADGKVLPSNEQGAKRYKCGACGGIGFVKQGVAEVSDETLTSYLSKVHADSQKHEKDPSKRSAEKRNKSVQGFSRAFNKLDARKAQTDEVSKGTLGSYLKKAHQDVVDRASRSSFQSGQAGDKYNKADATDKDQRRHQGIVRAVKRLVGEDQEVQRLLHYARSHYPNSKDDQEAFMKYVFHALKHSEDDDMAQYKEISLLKHQVDSLAQQKKLVAQPLKDSEQVDEISFLKTAPAAPKKFVSRVGTAAGQQDLTYRKNGEAFILHQAGEVFQLLSNGQVVQTFDAPLRDVQAHLDQQGYFLVKAPLTPTKTSSLGGPNWFKEGEEDEVDYDNEYQNMVQRMAKKAADQERERGPVDLADLARKLRSLGQKDQD